MSLFNLLKNLNIATPIRHNTQRDVTRRSHIRENPTRARTARVKASWRRQS